MYQQDGAGELTGWQDMLKNIFSPALQRALPRPDFARCATTPVALALLDG